MSLPDVMPTILDPAGIDQPDRVQAQPLAGLINSEVDALHDFVVTSWPMYLAGQRIRVIDDEERRMRENQPSTMTSKNWTLLYSIAGEPVELYNRKTDLAQEDNVFFATY